jgi:hypothetical protein
MLSYVNDIHDFHKIIMVFQIYLLSAFKHAKKPNPDLQITVSFGGGVVLFYF